MAYTTQLKVRFSDVDRAGIAYYPRIVNYFHVAFEDFFEGFVGVPYATVIERDNLGFPAVHLDVDFQAPFRFGDLILAEVAVEKVGRTSAVFRYRFFDQEKNLHAGAKVTVVCVRMDTLQPTPIPEEYREPFLRARVEPE